jgi:hypothetical protein
MNQDIGFLLTHIDNTAWYDNILKQIRLLIDNNPYKHICVFNSYSEKLDTYNVPLLHISQAKFFEGNIFVFDIVALCIIKNFPLIQNKYFFSRDIPWYRSYNNYQEWTNIFNQNNLNIIAQNQEIYDLYEICWQKPIDTMENFEYDKLSKIL